MTKTELAKRYSIFFISVALQGFAIALVTIADLGQTPISSPNYVLSLHTPLTLGQVTFIFNTMLIVLQFILHKGDEEKSRLPLLLQFPITLVFATAIDLGIFILKGIMPHDLPYVIDFAVLIAAVILLGFSISLQVTANAALIPGEGTVKIISRRLKKEFGYVKIGFDLSLVTTAVILSLIFTGFQGIDGVREGTIISALLTGPLVRIFMPKVKFLNAWFVKEIPAVAAASAALSDFKLVITISREYGCGGRIIGKKIAEDLGIAFYDTNLIDMVSKESGLAPEFVRENDQAMDSSLLFQMIMQDYFSMPEQSLSSQDALYVACSRVIRRLAKEQPCVIVGRGADAILKDNPFCFNVYLYASLDKKLLFCRDNYHQNEEEALKAMQVNDHRRAEHYLHYTGKKINDPKNYHLCLDVGSLKTEAAAQFIEGLVKLRSVPVAAGASS